MKLTENEWEVLTALVYSRFESTSDFTRKHAEGGVAPLDFGGRNGSHHGATATRLVAKGLVEHKKRGFDWGKAPTHYRGSKLYRATEAGRDFVAAERNKP